MCRNSKKSRECLCLVGMHIGAFIIIGATILSLSVMCKEKLSKIFSKLKSCACSCKDECECTCEEVKNDIFESDAQKESTSNNTK